MKVISFDPGYERLGIAVLEKNHNKETLLFSECFKTKKEDVHFDRMKQIGDRVLNLLKEHSPDYSSIEGLFFSKNTTTALKVAEIRGILIYLCKQQNIPVFEFTPNQIKVAVTGYGNSDKKSVSFMVKKLVSVPESVVIDDELDAIACGLTFFAHQNTLL